MGKKLNTYVHAVERDADGNLTGRSGTFGPDDDLSKSENAWVAKAVTNPDVWAGDESDEATPDASANTDSAPADVALAGNDAPAKSTRQRSGR